MPVPGITPIEPLTRTYTADEAVAVADALLGTSAGYLQCSLGDLAMNRSKFSSPDVTFIPDKILATINQHEEEFVDRFGSLGTVEHGAPEYRWNAVAQWLTEICGERIELPGCGFILRLAGCKYRERSYVDLQFALQEIYGIRTRARIADPDAEVNILRQGFLLLMMAFDAAIVDLVRGKLQKDFFRLVGDLGDYKMSLKEMGKYSSFEEMREAIVEKQLKGRFLKDLLIKLKDSWDVQNMHGHEKDGFVKLIELVLRRNIHVHNRGIVDDRYLERNQGGKCEYNPYKLKIGEAAPIDEQYWASANYLCRNCVTRVFQWAC
jgi:hypothetical protein